MKILDLFCKAGGCSMGYHNAGFEVVGVDIEPQPNYPFEFIQADAVAYLKNNMKWIRNNFDVIHASPPCQKHSKASTLGKARNGGKQKVEHVDFIEPIRPLLIESNLPYVIENVVGAPLIDPITLCGSMFPNLKVYRHRLFESNMALLVPQHYPHRDSTPSAGNGISPKGFISICGTGGVRGMKAQEIIDYWSMAMGIDWMNRKELAQAIPPAFTEFIGQQLLDQLKLKETA